MLSEYAIGQLEKIRNAFIQIGGAIGNEKQLVLAEYSHDPDVVSGLWYQFNPLVTFGIREAKYKKKIIQDFPDPHYDTIDELFEEFRLAPAVTDQMIGKLQVVVKYLDTHLDRYDGPLLGVFLANFMMKNLKIGVTATTINKVLGKDSIPSFGCMLAQKYFEHPEAVENQLFAVTKKLDGIRCLAIYRPGGKVVFHSRQGQLIEGLVEIEPEIRDLLANEEFSVVLDGELLVDEADELDSAEGYKRTTKIVRSKADKHGVTYNVFDVVSLTCFLAGKDNTLYFHRYDKLRSLFKGKQYNHLKRVEQFYVGNDTSMIYYHLNAMRDAHQEGVMINLLDAPYECKRTKNLLKVKVMQDCDLKIIGVEEGSGKFAHTLGALIVDYKGNPVGVGSGISNLMRETIWKHPEQFIGRVATIQYFEETHDANGVPSIRFPVFKELRERGKEVSYE